MYKYYSTQRPIVPGAYPKPAGNPILGIINLDERRYEKEIDREVWGWIEYKNPLTVEEAKNYELTLAKRGNGA